MNPILLIAVVFFGVIAALCIDEAIKRRNRKAAADLRQRLRSAEPLAYDHPFAGWHVEADEEGFVWIDKDRRES